MTELLSISDYAVALRQSRSNLYILLAAKSIPPTFAIGGRQFIRRSTVERFLADREAAALADAQ